MFDVSQSRGRVLRFSSTRSRISRLVPLPLATPASGETVLRHEAIMDTSTVGARRSLERDLGKRQGARSSRLLELRAPEPKGRQ